MFDGGHDISVDINIVHNSTDVEEMIKIVKNNENFYEVNGLVFNELENFV